jgi:hypothetical protein
MSIDDLVKKTKIGLNPDKFNELLGQGYIGIDSRHKNEFLRCFVPGTINNDL